MELQRDETRSTADEGRVEGYDAVAWNFRC